MLTIAFNTYKQSQNHFYMFLAISYSLIGIPIILHTLSYQGMNIFPNITNNIPTQLYVIIRYLLSFSLIISFLFLHKPLSIKKVTAGYSIIITFLVFSVYWGIFPDAFIQGEGLTLFKVISEYINILILIGAIACLYYNKNQLHPKVFDYMLYSILFTMASGIFFALYTSVFGLSNMLGHLAQLFSFYYLYKGIVETSLKTPFEFLYYELQNKSQELEIINQQLLEYNMEIEAQKEELTQAYERIHQDVEKARKIHDRFLPKAFPQIEKLDFAYYYRPAQNIGGDFFHIQKIGNQLIVYLVDVSGHGLDGAILNIFIRENIKNYLSNMIKKDEAISPKNLLSHLYTNYNKESFPNDYYACTFAAVIELTDHSITYSNAGLHISPYVVSGGNLHRLIAAGLPIMNSITNQPLPYEDHKIQLEEDYTLLFTTDGLVEEMRDDLVYGEERVAKILINNAHLSPKEIIKAIERDFQQFLDQNIHQDDITFLVIKRQ